MQIRSDDDGRLVVMLEQGESIRGSIENVARQQNIGAALVFAIGSIRDPSLGSYVPAKGSYRRCSFDGVYRLLSMQGNISLFDGDPILHAHVTLAGDDFAAIGGDLFDGQVGTLVEAFVLPLSDSLHRIADTQTGFPRWNLEHSPGMPR